MQKERKKNSENSQERKVKYRNHDELQEKILENLVALQKVHTDVADKFSRLSEQIANLLGLFEMAARSFAQNPVNQITEKDKEFLDKVDKLLEQNKTIAKGLTLMEERIREKIYGPPSRMMPVQSQNPRSFEETSSDAITKPLPKF